MTSIVPIPTVSLAEGDKKRLSELLELLTELDDVVEVWSNLA